MTKKVFLSELRTKLSGLPEQELNESLHFYNEMIDDRIEEGIPEEDAVAAAGDINEIAAQIKESAVTKRAQQGVRVWLILLLVLGSPVLIPLYISLWAVIISLWAVFVTLAAVSLCCYFGAPVLGMQGNLPAAVAAFGAGLLLTGCTIFLFFGCLAASKGICQLTKKIFCSIRRSNGKERF